MIDHFVFSEIVVGDHTTIQNEHHHHHHHHHHSHYSSQARDHILSSVTDNDDDRKLLLDDSCCDSAHQLHMNNNRYNNCINNNNNNEHVECNNSHPNNNSIDNPSITISPSSSRSTNNNHDNIYLSNDLCHTINSPDLSTSSNSTITTDNINCNNNNNNIEKQTTLNVNNNHTNNVSSTTSSSNTSPTSSVTTPIIITSQLQQTNSTANNNDLSEFSLISPFNAFTNNSSISGTITPILNSSNNNTTTTTSSINQCNIFNSTTISMVPTIYRLRVISDTLEFIIFTPNHITVRDLKIRIFNEFNGLFKNNITLNNPLYSHNFERCKLQDRYSNDLSEPRNVCDLLNDMDPIHIVIPKFPITNVYNNNNNNNNCSNSNTTTNNNNSNNNIKIEQQPTTTKIEQPKIDQQIEIQLSENFLTNDDDNNFKLDSMLVDTNNHLNLELNSNIDLNENFDELSNHHHNLHFTTEIENDRLKKKFKTEIESESSSVVSSPISSSSLSTSTNTSPQQQQMLHPIFTDSQSTQQQQSQQHLIPTISSLPIQIKPASHYNLQQLQGLHSLSPLTNSQSTIQQIPTQQQQIIQTTPTPTTTATTTSKSKSKKLLSLSTSTSSTLSSSTGSTNGMITPPANRCTPYCTVSNEKNQECSICFQIRPYAIIHTDGSESNICTKWCISGKARKQKSINLEFCSICLSRSRTLKYHPQNHQCQECQRPWMMLSNGILCKRCFKINGKEQAK